MSDIGLNMDPLFYGVGIALLVTLLGTPAAWRLLSALPHARRAFAACLGCIGLSGLIGMSFALASSRHGETVIFAVLASAALQGALFLILLLFSPKRP
jgi:hypothetical protein